MKAIVCDKCGKVVLLPDEPSICPEGINVLYIEKTRKRIDLCDECTEELVDAVRRGE